MKSDFLVNLTAAVLIAVILICVIALVLGLETLLIMGVSILVSMAFPVPALTWFQAFVVALVMMVISAYVRSPAPSKK